MGNKINIPDEWRPVDDYSSHRPLLYAALLHTTGIVIELGAGSGSTQLLRRHCLNERPFFSYDSNFQWAQEMYSGWVSDWDHPARWSDIWVKCGLLFVDHSPGEHRKIAIDRMRDKADIIVVHDTEDYAQRVYEIVDVLKSFKYRKDLHIPAHPSTTALSNTIDVTNWEL